ncbi:MAG: hypothetical protein RSC41_04325, partial [Oscillospiraceae bacterium]
GDAHIDPCVQLSKYDMVAGKYIRIVGGDAHIDPCVQLSKYDMVAGKYIRGVTGVMIKWVCQSGNQTD